MRKTVTFYLSSRRKICKNKGYLKTVEKYANDTFRQHFRMQKSTFEPLVRKLEPFWPQMWTGRPLTPLRHALYVTIWKLANQCTYRDVSDRFNFARGTSYNLVLKLTKLIYKKRKLFIKWPYAYTHIVEEFQNLRKSPFPFVVGCIDGTHIPIPAPSENSESYYNRKGFHSLILQGVCDARCVFTDIYFGLPGRMHDAAVWGKSPLYNALSNKSVILPEGAHLLGDSAYPLSAYMMVPYRDNGYLREAERKFNICLSKTRVCIEQAFGILKNKFRILKYLDVENLHNAKYLVFSCIALHNFIICCEGFKELEEDIVDLDAFCNLNEREEETLQNRAEAQSKRDSIANLICA